ncbi:thiosulfate transporter subunit, partial [Salinivibrio kushneri]
MKVFKTLALSALLATSAAPVSAAEQTLLNSSYDIARELFADYNPLFAAHWQEKTGESVTIKQSHGGSSAQARAIM